MSETEHAVVIDRVINAPIDLVWKLWTEADHFAAWYGPAGASIPLAKMDVRVGGSRHIGMEMETPNGPMKMFFAGEYKEIVENEKLVYTELMADADGAALSPESMGMPPGAPMETQVTVELSEAEGGTRVVMTHAGIPADSPGAMGWNMAFDKLADYAASQG